MNPRFRSRKENKVNTPNVTDSYFSENDTGQFSNEVFVNISSYSYNCFVNYEFINV